MSPQKKTNKAPAKKPVGRPATGRERPLQVKVRVSQEERDGLEAKAATQGLTINAYCRKVLGLGE